MMMHLETLFLELNQQHFTSKLPVPKLIWNSRLRSSAGRFTPGSRIHLNKVPVIEIAQYLLDIENAEFHIRDTLLHEMVHYLLWHEKKPYGHTPEFNRILKKVGARRYNSVPKHTHIKHWYECPNCNQAFPAKRKLRPSACAKCCKKFNNGIYSPQFLLRLRQGAPIAAELPVAIHSAQHNQEFKPQFTAAEIIRKLEELKNILVKPKARN